MYRCQSENAVGGIQKDSKRVTKIQKKCFEYDMMSWKDIINKKAGLDDQGMLWKLYSEYQCELRIGMIRYLNKKILFIIMAL